MQARFDEVKKAETTIINIKIKEFSQMGKNLEAVQVGLKDLTSSTMPMPIAPLQGQNMTPMTWWLQEPLEQPLRVGFS